MKVQYQLTGTYRRLQVSGTSSAPISLTDLIQKIRAIANQNHLRSLPLLRQSFALEFLPEPILINLLQQAQGSKSESDLYQLTSLQLLHSVKPNLLPTEFNTYCYQFICPEFTLDLTPDDPQIPMWKSNEEIKSGTYTIFLNPNLPNVATDIVRNIWQQGVKQWQSLTEIQKIHTALNSLDPHNFCLKSPQNPQLQVWIESQDLCSDLRSAITFLRLGSGDTSVLPETVKILVGQYQSQHSISFYSSKIPPVCPQSSTSSTQVLAIGKRSRSLIKKIITNARQFLLLSSYIIEDEELTELICQQAQTLPQGVWILTDLRNEIVNRIDIRVAESLTTPEEFQRTDARKKACLRMLLNSNVRIRSGAFHLKTYISEQSAYLGSCNLTKGSLDFNLEAGVIFQNNSVHTQLIDAFRQFWQQRSRDEVIPMSNYDGFQLHSINYRSLVESENYHNLLTPYQYKEDLLHQLKLFNGTIQIYSRSFFPTTEIEQFLKLLNTQVYVESQFTKSLSKINLIAINKLHAKITLLGNQVAYIGGINFNFNPKSFSLTDLMYKTTDSQEIAQIRQKIISSQ